MRFPFSFQAVAMLFLFMAPVFAAAAASEDAQGHLISYSCGISPSQVSATVGSSVPLGLACYADDGESMASVPCEKASWSSTIGAVSGSNAGAIFDARTAPGAGSISASAEIGASAFKCDVPATVSPGEAASISITPASASIVVGQAQQFFASLYDAYGNRIAYSGHFSWSASPSSVGSISDSGLFTALAEGTANVKAAYQHLDASAAVSVGPQPSSRYCEISPSDAKMTVMESQKFQARCFESIGGRVQEFGCPSLSWSAVAGKVSPPGIENGLQTVSFTAGKVAGSASLSAKYDRQSAAESILCSSTIEILPGDAASVELSPSSAQLLVGDTLGFSATATDEFGNKLEGARLFWSASGGAGSIDSNGLFTATAAGSGSVRVDVSCMSSSAEGCPHDIAQVAVSNPATPPGGSTGGSSGGSNGGGSFASSSTISFTCAGAPATLAVTVFNPNAAVAADVIYMGAQPPSNVLSQTATGSNTFTFTPANAGAYELRVSVGVDQRSTSFAVPGCTPSTFGQVQNITVELKPAAQPAIPALPAQQPATQGSQVPSAQQPAPAAKPSFLGIELPSDITALAAIGALVAAVILAASYFVMFGKKAERG
ncbi:MAG: Ig-like domain-containing protein [Candidatus Micrarchaeia archaeon]